MKFSKVMGLMSMLNHPGSKVRSFSVMTDTCHRPFVSGPAKHQHFALWKINFTVTDDDFRFTGTATGFRSVGLCLYGIFAVQYCRFGQNNSAQDQSLSAGTT
jgi:hypothetical protein